MNEFEEKLEELNKKINENYKKEKIIPSCRKCCR